MIEEEDARAQILAAVPELVGEGVPLEEALGRYAASDVVATVALPGFNNSAMDGYAVRAVDSVAEAELRVVGEQPAGRELGLKLEAGEAIRIFTGAPIPAGSDAVVMQEDTQRDGEIVKILEATDQVGEFVRTRGSDLCEGQRILAVGDRISAQKIGLLASQGMSEVMVGKLPRVGILSTGDELVEPGRELGNGEIYNSNGVMLAMMARRMVSGGAMEVRRYHAADELGELKAIVEQALAENDVLVIAGGVSVGDRDLVKPVLETAGVEMGFWRVRLKPGKPFLFGRGDGGKLVFGLPGNPVSAFVTFEVFVASALRRWMGAREDEVLPCPIRVELGGELRNTGDRPHYFRGTLERSTGRFLPGGMQQSHALNGLARADALLRVEAGATLDVGAEVAVFPVA